MKEERKKIMQVNSVLQVLWVHFSHFIEFVSMLHKFLRCVEFYCNYQIAVFVAFIVLSFTLYFDVMFNCHKCKVIPFISDTRRHCCTDPESTKYFCTESKWRISGCATDVKTFTYWWTQCLPCNRVRKCSFIKVIYFYTN